MNIMRKLRKLISYIPLEYMDDIQREQFARGFRDGYSDPSCSDVGEKWYMSGVRAGRDAHNSGMTMGSIDISNKQK